MTQRERQTSAGVLEVAPCSTATSSPSLCPGPSVSAAVPLSRWEDLYTQASAAEQADLLALAERQGLLYGQQLPTPGPISSRHRPVLSQLLSTPRDALEPVRIRMVPVGDPDLDEVQREAVARALQTPDVCLIQGGPGTGKSRVAAEIIAQAVARGERVLLAAPCGSALDGVLIFLTARAAACPFRCVGKDESADSLPASSRRLTLAGHLEQVETVIRPAARLRHEELTNHLQRLGRDRQRLAILYELTERLSQLAQAAGELNSQRASLDDQVQREAHDAAAATPFALAFREREAPLRAELLRREQECKEAQDRLDDSRRQLHDLTVRIHLLQPLAEAQNEKRWWSAWWWRAAFLGNVSNQYEELQAMAAAAAQQSTQCEQQLGQLRAEQQHLATSLETELTRLLEQERDVRRTSLDDRESAIRQEERELRDKAERSLLDLEVLSPPPALNPESAREALTACREETARVGAECAFAEQWRACLEEHPDALGERVVGLANLVAATVTALPGDRYFGDGAGPQGRFDLLVLKDADQVSESDFYPLARRASRCVLIGQPTARGQNARFVSARGGFELSRPGRAGRPSNREVQPSLFHKAWWHLHCDPGELPYAWSEQQGGRLCCRLRAIPPEQARHLESEHVADSPDVELRILAVPRAAPVLAEVVFPPSMTLRAAKEYIYSELEELPIVASGSNTRWVEYPDRLVLRLAGPERTHGDAVSLERGVREFLAQPSTSGQTCCLEFDRSAGWHRSQAEKWVQEHLGVLDLGRTIRLEVPHRMRPDLGAFVLGWLASGTNGSAECASLPAPETAALSPPVEFIAVPPVRDLSPRGSRRAQGAPGRRGGAGFEADLADPRQRDSLPADLHSLLPARGLVNYTEAQAVVGYLEDLARTSSTADGAESNCTATGPAIGIMALSPAQVELIRCLISRSTVLAGSPLDLEVGLPRTFQHRDCLVGIISLTRSHTHRAVTLGDGPQDLALALTRARERLVLFGDPGTLARRAQWEGAVEQLDEQSAARERELVRRLLDYLDGNGCHPGLLQVRESTHS